MSSNQYDHCRNCKFWDAENKSDTNDAKCSKHNEATYIRSWCGQHEIADKYNYNDPSVIYSFSVDMFIRSGNPNIPAKVIHDGLKMLGYTGPDDFYIVIREYDINYPKRES